MLCHLRPGHRPGRRLTSQASPFPVQFVGYLALAIYLDAVLPGFAGHVVEAEIQRWPTGAPFCFPGRAKLQPALRRRTGRVFLAGDYLGSWYAETAALTGAWAAANAREQLAA